MKVWALVGIALGSITFVLVPATEPVFSSALPSGYEINYDAAKYWISIAVGIMSALAANSTKVKRWWNPLVSFLSKMPMIGNLFEPQADGEAFDISEMIVIYLDELEILDSIEDKNGHIDAAKQHFADGIESLVKAAIGADPDSDPDFDPKLATIAKAGLNTGDYETRPQPGSTGDAP